MAVDCRRSQVEHRLQTRAIHGEGWRADRRRRERAQLVLPFAPGGLTPRCEVAKVAGVVTTTRDAEVLLIMEVGNVRRERCFPTADRDDCAGRSTMGSSGCFVADVLADI